MSNSARAITSLGGKNESGASLMRDNRVPHQRTGSCVCGQGNCPTENM